MFVVGFFRLISMDSGSELKGSRLIGNCLWFQGFEKTGYYTSTLGDGELVSTSNFNNFNFTFLL